MAAMLVDDGEQPAGELRTGYMSGFFESDEYNVETEESLESGCDNLTDKKCGKNPLHKGFYQVQDLSLDILPDDLKSGEKLELIKTKVNLTVKVMINYVSEKRPDCFRDNKLPYPGRLHRGKKKKINGTGAINRVLSQEPVKKLCPCHQCRKLNNEYKMTEHFLFTIRTATHVVFDNSEAESATFECFFDYDDGRNVKFLYGLSVDGTQTSYSTMFKDDVCEVVCVTHDRDLANRIIAIVSTVNIPPGVPHTFPYALPPEGVIVSHPHGVAKRITFGRVIYATVPIKPEFQVGEPTFLPSPTKYRLRPMSYEGPDEQGNDSDYKKNFIRMVTAILQNTTEDETRPVNRIAKRVAGPNVTSSRLQTPKYKPPRPSQEPGIHSTNTNNQNALAREACNQLFDSLARQNPFPPEFSNFYNDNSGVGGLLESTHLTPSTAAPFQLVNPLIPASATALQSSTPHPSGESVTNDDISARRELATNFVTTMCSKLGVQDSMVRECANLIKNLAPALMDDTRPVNQQQIVWEDLFTNVFNISDHHSENRANGGNNDGDHLGKTSGDGNWENVAVQSTSSEATGANNDNGSVSAAASGAGINDCGKVDKKYSLNSNDDKVTAESTSVEVGAIGGSPALCSPSTDDASATKSGSDENVRDRIIYVTQTDLQNALDQCNPQTRTVIGDVGVTADLVKDMFKSLGPWENPDDIDPNEEFTLPFALNFKLPPEAENKYAMRYYKERPGWFSFYPGTEICTSHGTPICRIAQGTEFQSPMFTPRHSLLTYDIPVCPGSSGASVYSELVGKKYNTFYPHCSEGKTSRGEKINVSGAQENTFAGSLAVVSESMNRSVQKHVADKLDKHFEDFDLN